jgi:DNA-binding CsgD family transcriptional regulator
MVKSKDFFISENEIAYVSDEDYSLIELYIQLLDAFVRTTYKSIYVIDYYRKNFLYVSDNSLFLCGMSAAQVQETGYEFYIRQVLNSDLPLLLEINRAGFMFTETVPPENRLEYTLSYDFHIRQASGKAMLINHKITPLRLTKDGRVWLALCTASISSQVKAGNIEITRKGCNVRRTYCLKSNKWKECAGIELKDNEKDVLRLSAQGYTMSEISEQLCKSLDTIKGYKRQLFEKLEVDNITEAIFSAINKKLI